MTKNRSGSALFHLGRIEGWLLAQVSSQPGIDLVMDSIAELHSELDNADATVTEPGKLMADETAANGDGLPAETSPKRKRGWSPEQRAAAAERMRRMHAVKAANNPQSFSLEEPPDMGEGGAPPLNEASGADL